MNSDPRLLLTVREVSTLTGLTVGTLYHLVSQQRIPVVRLSARCIRFRISDLERWISRMTEPVSEIWERRNNSPKERPE